MKAIGNSFRFRVIYILLIYLILNSCDFGTDKFPDISQVSENNTSLPIEGTWQVDIVNSHYDIVKNSSELIKQLTGIKIDEFYSYFYRVRILKGRIYVIDAPSNILLGIPIGSVVVKDLRVKDKYSYQANAFIYDGSKLIEIPTTIVSVSDSIIVENRPTIGFHKNLVGDHIVFRYKLIKKDT